MEFPVYTRSGIELVRGDGYRVWDSNGKEYLDFYGGHAVALLGYNNKGLTTALSDQAKNLIFTSNAVDSAVRTKACADLAGIAPGPLDRAFLVNSGAEANEAALRIAFWKTGRKKVVALNGSFHGRTAATSAITYGSDAWYGFPSKPFEVEFIEPEEVTSLNEEVAAFIFEPVQGVAGAVRIPSEFLANARKTCTDNGIVMIADEVQSGMGRSGCWWASPVIPDLMTSAKGLAGGFPAAAVLAPADWADNIPKGHLGTTFGAGPMACALISEVISQITPEIKANVGRLSKRIFEEAPVIKVSGLGFLIGLHVGRPASEVLAALRERGILAGDSKDPQVVRLLPPLIIDDAAVDQLLIALKEVLV